MVVDQYGNPFGVGDYVLIAEQASECKYIVFVSVVQVAKIEWDEYWGDYRVYFERWYPIKERGELLYRHAKECVVTTEHNYLVALKRRDEWDERGETSERQD